MTHVQTFQFKTVPYKHQVDAWNMGFDRDYFAYFMEMGTGKSKVAIDDFCVNWTMEKIDAVLIFANNGSYRNWAETQIPTHCPDNILKESYVGVWKEDSGSVINDPKLDPQRKSLLIFVMNIEALSYKKGFEAAMEFVKNRKVMAIFDESTTLKHMESSRTKAAIKIAKFCKIRRILTGDPITNSPLDLYSQCMVLSPNALGFASYYAFRNYFAIMIQISAGQRSFKKVTGYQNLDKLTERLKRFSFRVKKEDCLDLPPKVYQKVYVELTDEQRQAYDNLREECIHELKNSVVTTPLVITKMVKLHQIVCGHLVDDEGQLHVLKSNRISALLDLIEETNNKVIIWANYRYSIQSIYEELIKGYGTDLVKTFYGDTSGDDRVEASRSFQDGKARFMIANQMTGGFGNTWTAAQTVVYFSNNYQLELRRQSEDRAHRIGQLNSVNYVDLVCKGTVDEKIINALRNHSQVASATLGDTWREWI